MSTYYGFCLVCRTPSLFILLSLSLSPSVCLSVCLSVSQTEMSSPKRLYPPASTATPACFPSEPEWTGSLRRSGTQPWPASLGKLRRRQVIKAQPKHQEPFAFLLHLKRIWRAHYLCETEGSSCLLCWCHPTWKHGGI